MVGESRTGWQRKFPLEVECGGSPRLVEGSTEAVYVEQPPQWQRHQVEEHREWLEQGSEENK